MNASAPTAPGRARRGHLAGIATAAAIGAGLLVLYLIHPAISSFRFPIGPDGPVYTWLARLAAETGFADAPGAGPGVPALSVALASILRIEAVDAVMLLGPVLAAACGLTAGALLESTLGPDRLRTLTGAALTGAFTAYLAGGWLANVAMVGVFLAAVAVLSASGSSRRSVWAGAALLAAAGLAHRVFVLIAAAILVAAAGWRVFLSLRRGETPRAGVRLATAAVCGPAAGLLIGGWVALGPTIPGDTSQDGFFRRVGLRELLLDRYRERFLGDAARASIPVASGAALAAPWVRGRADAGDGARYVREVLASWAILTAAGLLVLGATGWGPPYRVVQFAFFLPLAAAAGAALLARRSRLAAAFAALLVAAFVGASMVGWFRQAPAFSSNEVAAAARAGAAASPLPDGTPLVFLVDTDERAAAYHVTRAANVIRMGIPPERIDDVRIAVGEPGDLLAGRPTLTGDAEHDRISRVYFREASPALEEAAILVIARFNEGGFAEASELGVVVADEVVALTRSDEMLGIGDGEIAPPSGLGALELFLLSMGALLACGLLGWGWSRWILPNAGGRAVALAAPSTGVAVTILATVAADRVGILPSSGGALAVIGSLGLAGYLVAAREGT